MKAGGQLASVRSRGGADLELLGSGTDGGKVVERNAAK